MSGGVRALIFLLALGVVGLDLDCARPAQARALAGRAMLAEIEAVEDISREAMWQAFGRCPAGTGASRCRAEARQRFEADLDRQKAGIREKYRKLLADFEERCRAIPV